MSPLGLPLGFSKIMMMISGNNKDIACWTKYPGEVVLHAMRCSLVQLYQACPYHRLIALLHSALAFVLQRRGSVPLLPSTPKLGI